MAIHVPDSHKYHPVLDEKVIAVVKVGDPQKQHDYLDIVTGFNGGMDPTYWKDGYRIRDMSGQEFLCCPGLLYPRTLTAAEVWSRIADRFTPYVFLTPPNWQPEPGDDDEDHTYNIPAPAFNPGHRDKEDKRSEDHVSLAHGGEEEYCPMCADRHKYWAVSPPVFMSRHSRRWHFHVDCLQHLMPRRQFGLKPIDVVDFV